MSDVVAATPWTERAADRSPRVQRSRARSVEQARVIVGAAQRLIFEGREEFTIQDLVGEAGVALQTFYRYFGSKDELLLAVLEDLIAQGCADFDARAGVQPDPVSRLRTLVTAVVDLLGPAGPEGSSARFIAGEHWRLAKLFPDEIVLATKPYADLLAAEIRAGTEAGLLQSADPDHDAWLMTQLVMSVYHYRAFGAPETNTTTDDLWRFCLAALRGADG